MACEVDEGARFVPVAVSFSNSDSPVEVVYFVGYSGNSVSYFDVEALLTQKKS